MNPTLEGSNPVTEPPDDICPRVPPVCEQTTRPHSTPIYLSSVYECESPAQADLILSGDLYGYAYSRDGHPNADVLAEQCRRLHCAERATVASSGMGALAVALLSQAKGGDHLVVSNQLYGRSLRLLTNEAARLDIETTVVDTSNLAATKAAIQSNTRLLVVETISNPLLRVADIAALADVAHAGNSLLLVDNTFASPGICRPLEFGADFVLESLTKIMNGHSDVVLGVLCGPEKHWSRISDVASTWGLAASPFDCWLAARGLGTLHLRVERASANALRVAEFLHGRVGIARVHYPGLAEHLDHTLATRQFGNRFGSIVTFDLTGGRPAADAFIAAGRIPFCPSLGELATTLSHPQATSHRGLTREQQESLGISGGTIRLSVGIESIEFLYEALDTSLDMAPTA